MLRLATFTLLVAALPAAPALAARGTTGGPPARVPPVVSPEGGVDGPRSAPSAAAATAGDQAPADPAPAPAPKAAAPAAPVAHASQSPGDESTADPSPATEPAAASPSSGGGGLPHTGFALAALVAVGTGFFLTGYALRYSRALDG